MMNEINKDQTVNRLTYTVPEVANLLGIGINAAYKLVRSKGFPCIQIGRKIVIPKERFNLWLNIENFKWQKEMN